MRKSPSIFALLIFLSISFHAVLLARARWEPSAKSAATPPEPPAIEMEIIRQLPPAPEPEHLPEPEPESDTPPPPEPEPLPEPEPEPFRETEPPPAETLPPPPRPEPPAPQVSKPAPQRPAVQRKTSPAPAPASPAVVKASPEAHRNPPPAYPEIARRNQWEGRVMVRAEVSERGRVESVSLARSSGHPVLDRAALAAVRGWKFRPGSINGANARSTVEVPVNFRLR